MQNQNQNQNSYLLEQLKEQKALISQAKSAARELVLSSTKHKNKVLLDMAEIIEQNCEVIIEANKLDLNSAKQLGIASAMIDRLSIDRDGIKQMCRALREVAQLEDPLEATSAVTQRPNGIRVSKKRIPLGVILMIYEARPNVTVEAASLAFKSGNAIILRGGKEALQTNLALAQCWRKALSQNDFSESLISVLSTPDRSLLDELLKMDELIDVVIPRGGEGLIRHVVRNSHIPVIKHYKGVCHLYVDQEADFDKAINIAINGKTQRPGVCNALEGIIVHQNIAEDFLPLLAKAVEQYDVEILGCETACSVLKKINVATEADFDTEFLSLKMTLKVVQDLEEAISFIDRFGSGHTEVIVTENNQVAEKFLNRVDASVVMWNASSRFSDGGELGLGAEIGISTSKLHAYGPMGLAQLTSEKFVVVGNGQVRE